jgi:hypothetical protein
VGAGAAGMAKSAADTGAGAGAEAGCIVSRDVAAGAGAAGAGAAEGGSGEDFVQLSADLKRS